MHEGSKCTEVTQFFMISNLNGNESFPLKLRDDNSYSSKATMKLKENTLNPLENK